MSGPGTGDGRPDAQSQEGPSGLQEQPPRSLQIPKQGWLNVLYLFFLPAGARYEHVAVVTDIKSEEEGCNDRTD